MKNSTVTSNLFSKNFLYHLKEDIMTKTKSTGLLIISLVLVLLIGCVSEELRSAKLYIQLEDWEKKRMTVKQGIGYKIS